jgi:hypothetical protein
MIGSKVSRSFKTASWIKELRRDFPGQRKAGSVKALHGIAVTC